MRRSIPARPHAPSSPCSRAWCCNGCGRAVLCRGGDGRVRAVARRPCRKIRAHDMNVGDLLGGIGAGLAGGLTSGLLGVSPGGGLVVFSVLLLGAGQHVAQGISLVAQVPPTSLAGIRRYWQTGNRTPLRWIVLLTIGFVAGGAAGALAANNVSDPVLRWSYVVYLVALDAMLILRGGRDKEEDGDDHQ